MAVGILFLSMGAVFSLGLPTAMLFQFWSPSPIMIPIGAVISLMLLPAVVFFITNFASTQDKDDQRFKNARKLAMFFSVFVFASVIDLIVSLEHDGYLSGNMAFYLEKGEPYLHTTYAVAIQYWDGIGHCILYFALVYDCYNRNVCFRDVSMFWFGSFFFSMLGLLLGSLAGNYIVTYSCLLNLIYLFGPICYLIWVTNTISRHQDSTFGTGIFSRLLRCLFGLLMVAFVALHVVRLLVTLDVMKFGLENYTYTLERQIHHPDKYPRITMLLYGFYGIPFCIYAIFCLAANQNSGYFRDVVMIHAGAIINGQVGYIGSYFVKGGDDLKTFTFFKTTSAQAYFWTVNILLLAGAVLLASFSYISSGKEDAPKAQTPRSSYQSPRGKKKAQ